MNSETEKLIDKAVARLRDDSVPAMPLQLLECEPETAQLITRQVLSISKVTWGIGIAVVVLTMIGLANIVFSDRDTPKLSEGEPPLAIRDSIATTSEKVYVQNLIELHPFEDVEQEIANMKSEIELLKMEAVSLDAIRKVDAMITKN